MSEGLQSTFSKSGGRPCFLFPCNAQAARCTRILGVESYVVVGAFSARGVTGYVGVHIKSGCVSAGLGMYRGAIGPYLKDLGGRRERISG